MTHFVTWFEIPVQDLDRAIRFYSKVFSVKLTPWEGPRKIASFPFAPGVASGALVEDRENAPSDKGTLIYLSGGKTYPFH